MGINRDVSGAERSVTNVVLMGSGEPFDNYSQTVKFIRLLHDPEGLGLSYRNISLSTCGLVPRMYEFIEEDLPVTLCISLHAADDETRQQILPVAKTYAITEVLGAAKKYYEKTGRRIIIEYALIRGLNDGIRDADRLKALLSGLNCHVNPHPVQPCERVRPAP